MLLSELQKIGFSDKEALVYLAGLELGQATILEIAKKAKIKRPTAYVIVEGFIKRGLASSFEKGKKRYFAMGSPERLLTMFRLREKELQEQEREFSSVLPDLKQIYTNGLLEGKPVVRFFEGKAGISAMRDELLKEKPEFLQEIAALDEAYRFFPPTPGDHRELFKKQARQVIYTTKRGAVLPKKDGPIERIFVPKKKFPFSADILIYNDKVSLISYKEKPIGVIIQDKEISQTLKHFFSFTWRSQGKEKNN